MQFQLYRLFEIDINQFSISDISIGQFRIIMNKISNLYSEPYIHSFYELDVQTTKRKEPYPRRSQIYLEM